MPRKLDFIGYQWGVKTSCGQPAGPRPCIFVDDEPSVRVESGPLHLVADSTGESPTCTEVVLEESLGFGEYRFTVAGALDGMDPNTVVGLFTYDPDPAWTQREIDVEIARWGDALNGNSQFVVQPHTTDGNISRFDIGGLAPTTHKFRWRSNQVLFRSLVGEHPYPSEGEEGLACWSYTGADLPPTGDENIHINLWWMGGAPGAAGAHGALEISAFEYVDDADLFAGETCLDHP
jgi:hypothetical protein